MSLFTAFIHVLVSGAFAFASPYAMHNYRKSRKISLDRISVDNERWLWICGGTSLSMFVFMFTASLFMDTDYATLKPMWLTTFLWIVQVLIFLASAFAQASLVPVVTCFTELFFWYKVGLAFVFACSTYFCGLTAFMMWLMAAMRSWQF